eukprot:EG_transcript_11041
MKLVVSTVFVDVPIVHPWPISTVASVSLSTGYVYAALPSCQPPSRASTACAPAPHTVHGSFALPSTQGCIVPRSSSAAKVSHWGRLPGDFLLQEPPKVMALLEASAAPCGDALDPS